MPPKKKLKSEEEEGANEINIPESSNNEPSLAKAEYEPTRLSFLPVDVLLYIYKFLSSADLLTLSQLGDPKFSQLADIQKEVNFSLCRKTSFELMTSYFSRERVKHIQKLNFSFYIYARAPDLVQIICRCKNLTVLSVIECGIQYKQILKILENCTALKELSWNVKNPVSEKETFCPSSVTKLFLYCNVPSRAVSSASRIFKNFPKIENAIVVFSQDALIVPPLITYWSKSLSLPSNDNLRWITVIRNFLIENQDGMILQAIIGINKELNELWKVTPNLKEDLAKYTDSCYNVPPYLKIKTLEKSISSLAKCNSNTYSSAIIFLTNGTLDVYDRFFKCLSNVLNFELKHLSIESEEYDRSIDSPTPNVLPEEVYEKIYVWLGTLFLNCKNITVLNFGTVHFASGSPFTSMCSLKNLRVLSIPTCAFPKTLSDSDDEQDQIQCSTFEDLVSECSRVEDFHLICCYNDRHSMKDTDIYPVQNWKQLLSFSIYSVIFKSMRFLRKIADCCTELQSFSLIETAPISGCIYYNDVMYLLRSAKNLSFIRINDRHFNPTFGNFMHAVSLAKNLEGICFMTELTTFFTTSSIINGIKSLKHLHLFHFYAPRVCDQLFIQVRKSMDKNGIKNIKIEKECIEYNTLFSGLENQLLELEGTQYFHLKPYFYCKHLHLKKFFFNFFSLF